MLSYYCIIDYDYVIGAHLWCPANYSKLLVLTIASGYQVLHVEVTWSARAGSELLHATTFAWCTGQVAFAIHVLEWGPGSQYTGIRRASIISLAGFPRDKAAPLLLVVLLSW